MTNRLVVAEQPALFGDDDVQTEGFARPEPRDGDTDVAEGNEPGVEAA